MKIPDDNQKKAIWDGYHQGKPIRVPVRWNVNPRVILLDPALNPDRIDFETYSHDPSLHLQIQARLHEYIADAHSKTSDTPSTLSPVLTCGIDNQNICDGAYFGAWYDAKVVYRPGQVPAVEHFLSIDDIDEFLQRDFSRPLENPWLKERLAFHQELSKVAQTFTHRNRPVRVRQFSCGPDGPLTTAADIFGSGIFMFLAAEPIKSRELMLTIVRAYITRAKAIADCFSGRHRSDSTSFADDSIQLIGTDMYEQIVLPAHQLWYDEMGIPGSRRSMHLCGDATRHFPIIKERLGVSSFDTGFPVDFASLRKSLGPTVEISGGVPVSDILQSSADTCHQKAKETLTSGIMDGGRFILQEANNLPPCAPQENLAAIYAADLEFGRY